MKRRPESRRRGAHDRRSGLRYTGWMDPVEAAAMWWIAYEGDDLDGPTPLAVDEAGNACIDPEWLAMDLPADHDEEPAAA